MCNCKKKPKEKPKKRCCNIYVVDLKGNGRDKRCGAVGGMKISC